MRNPHYTNRPYAIAVPLCLGLILVGLTNNSSCLAQQSTTVQTKAATTRSPQPAKRLKNTENPEFKSERVTKAMDLPDMPTYQGKKTQFVTGTIFRQVKGGPSLTEQFSVSETKPEVLQWYKDAFAANKWNIVDNITGPDGVAASKNNNICQVLTMKPSRLGSKCDVLVRYKFYKATKF